MKLLLTAVCFFIASVPHHLMVLDKDLKKPVKTADDFSLQDFMQSNFPIYAADKEAIIAAADKAAKWIEQTTTCYTADSLETANSLLVITTDCELGLAVTVRLYTTVAESATTYCLELMKNEPNKRKAQQRLMEFATYINQ